MRFWQFQSSANQNRARENPSTSSANQNRVLRHRSRQPIRIESPESSWLGSMSLLDSRLESAGYSLYIGISTPSRQLCSLFYYFYYQSATNIKEQLVGKWRRLGVKRFFTSVWHVFVSRFVLTFRLLPSLWHLDSWRVWWSYHLNYQFIYTNLFTKSFLKGNKY